MENLIFIKTGKEVKAAVQTRKVQLQSRLEKRNTALDVFLKDTRKVRSYIVRGKGASRGHMRGTSAVLVGADEISSEEQQEIQQLCARIHEIEQELHQLSLIETHLDDEQELRLKLEDLLAYGFSAEGIESVEAS